MDRDTVIRLAREARLVAQIHPLHPWGATDADLERFAALVAAHEREECAKVLEKLEQEWEDAELWASFKTIGIAIDAIRSRT